MCPFVGINAGNLPNYDKVEKNVRTFTNRFNIVFAAADITSMVFMPAFVAAFHYIKGTYDHNSWYMPLVTM